MSTRRICSVEGCVERHEARGFCNRHYLRFKKFGDPLAVAAAGHGEPLAFLLSIINSGASECVTWPYARTSDGYGSVRYESRPQLAHRIVCRLKHGEPVCLTLEAAHNCGNGHLGCVNPNHLRWATRQENQHDRVEHGTVLMGEAHGSSKLTASAVIDIRSKFAAGTHTKRQLADAYGIKRGSVRGIVQRKRWAHIA